MKQRSIPTQFGDLTLIEEDGAITRVDWGAQDRQDRSDLLDEAVRQLAAYDAGKLQKFDLRLWVKGTEFQRAVCDAIYAIPFGDTRTYGEIACDLDVPAQTVGSACGGNPDPNHHSVPSRDGCQGSDRIFRRGGRGNQSGAAAP